MNKEVLQSLCENSGPELNYVCGLILQNSDEDIDRFTDTLFKIFEFAGIESQRVGGKKKRGGGIKELKAYIILCFVLVTAFSARTCTEGKGYVWNTPDYNQCIIDRAEDMKHERAVLAATRVSELATIYANAQDTGTAANVYAAQGTAAEHDNEARRLANKAKQHELNMKMVKDWGLLLGGFLLAVAVTIGIVRRESRVSKIEDTLDQITGILKPLIQDGTIKAKAPSVTAPVATGASNVLALMPSPSAAAMAMSAPSPPAPSPPALRHPSAADLAAMAPAPLSGPLPGYNAVAGHNNLYNLPENNFYPSQMTHAAEAYNASRAHHRLYIPNPLQNARAPIGFTQLQTLEELHAAFRNSEPVGILWTRNPNYAGGKSRRRQKKRSTRKR
jgi:hypothetical protein